MKRMKIIIDIPVNVYSDYKYQVNHGIADPAKNYIVNGTPYEEKTGHWILKEAAPNVARLHCSECDGVSYTFLPSCPYCRSIMTRIEE